MTRALVTGSSGLLGHCLVSRLRDRGTPMRLYDVLPPSPEMLGPDVEVVQGDMRDPQTLRDAARGVDVIYHLAAGQRMKPQFSSMSEDDIRVMNVGGVRHMLDAAEAANVRKVVHISSSGIYGVPTTVPVTEAHPQNPLGAYGVSKIEAETLCREYLARGGDVTVFRPMSLFGPRMSGVFVLLYDWIHRNRPVYFLGSGRNRVQMVSAWDVADACLLAAHTPAARGGVFNLGALDVPTVREQVEAVVQRVGSRSRVRPVPAALLRNAARVLDVFGLSPIVPEHYLLADANFVLDVSEAQRVLGWTPRYSNVELMVEAYEWYVQHADTHGPVRGPVLKLLDLLP